MVDGGYTGKIDQVNTDLLEVLIRNGYVPVVAPSALGKDHELLNVDSDRAAAQIAGALRAEKVIFLTDVKGVLLEGKHVEKLNLGEAERLLPEIGPGMDKKVLASIEAIRAGVKEAVISSGFCEEPIVRAINHEVGTVITSE